MSSTNASASHRARALVGWFLVGIAVLLALTVAVLALAPAQTMKHRAAIGSTQVVEVPADRDWAVYSTLSTWRAAVCEVTDADGDEIVLRPDMVQQRLPGWPTWYPQGSFRLDQDQLLTVSCGGPAGQFAVGPSVGFGHLLLTAGVGIVGLLTAAAGLILLIMAAVGRNTAPRPGSYPRGG
jgi:hypothetical protein